MEPQKKKKKSDTTSIEIESILVMKSYSIEIKVFVSSIYGEKLRNDSV